MQALSEGCGNKEKPYNDRIRFFYYYYIMRSFRFFCLEQKLRHLGEGRGFCLRKKSLCPEKRKKHLSRKIVLLFVSLFKSLCV